MSSDLTSRTALELGRAKVRQSGRLTKGTYDEAKHPRGYHGHWLAAGPHLAAAKRHFTKAEDHARAGRHDHADLHMMEGKTELLRAATSLPEGHSIRPRVAAAARDVHRNGSAVNVARHRPAAKEAEDLQQYAREDAGAVLATGEQARQILSRHPSDDHPHATKPGMSTSQLGAKRGTGGRGSSRGRLGGDLGETHAAENAKRNAGRGKKGVNRSAWSATFRSARNRGMGTKAAQAHADKVHGGRPA